MLPIRDNVPTRSFPFVTIGPIIANALVWIWELRAPGVTSHVLRAGFYPCSLSAPCLPPAPGSPSPLVRGGVQIRALIFLGLWFAFQLAEGTYSLTHPDAGGGVAFFAFVGGFVFGLLTVSLAGRRDWARPPAYSLVTRG
jgi:membrane associated rhomboid family serine protease